jgi:hypothetical protein
MIISLDLKCFDYSFLISVCLENDMMMALIYLSLNGPDETFIAPLTKLWGSFLNFQSLGNLEKAHYFGLKSIWYIKICLERSY